MATEADVQERVAETFKEEKDREMLTEASNVVEKSEGIAEPLPKFEVQVTKGAIEVNGKNTEFIYESPLVTKVADEQILSPPGLNEDAVVLKETETKFLESSVGKETEKNRDEIISTIKEDSTEETLSGCENELKGKILPEDKSNISEAYSSQIAQGKFFEPDLAEEMKVLEPASSKEDVGEVTISEEGLGHTISKESENVNTDPEEMKSRGDMKDEDSNKETIPCDATGNANLKSENASDQKEEATEICENGNRNLDISSTVTPVEEKCIADAGSDNTFSEAIGSSDALENEHIVEAEASTGKPLSSSAVEPKYVTHHTEAKPDTEVSLASTEASDRSKVADEVQTEVEEPGKLKDDENFPDSETIQINLEEPLYATPDKIDVSESCQSTETTTTVVNLPEALKEATNDETLDAHYIPEKQPEDISTDDLKKEDDDIPSNTIPDLRSTHPLVDETKHEQVFEENQVHITEPTDIRDAHEANSIPECNTIVQTSDKESLNEMQDESAIAAKDKECESEETSEVETGQYVHEIPSSDSQSIENEKSVETGAEKTFTDDHSLSLQSPNKDVDSVGKEYSEASHVESEKVEKILEPATEVHFSEVSYEIEESGTKGKSLEAAVPESGVQKIPNKETNEANGTTENYISREKNISTVDLNEDENGDISCNAAKDLQSTLPPVEETKHEQVVEENQVLIEEPKHDAHEANITRAEEASEMELTSTRQTAADEIETESKLNFTEKLQIDAENNTEEKIQKPGEAFEEHDHETPKVMENTTHESETNVDLSSVATSEQACLQKEEPNTPELRFKSFEEIQDESGIEAKEKEKSFTDEQSLISESAKKDVDDLAISYSKENEVLPEAAGKEYTEASHAETEHLEKILDRATPVLYSDYKAEESGINEESLEPATIEIGVEKIPNEEKNEAKGTTESYISSEKNIRTVDLNDEEDVDTPCYTPKDLQNTIPLVEETKQEKVREENEVPIEELKHVHDAHEAISIPESSTINQTLTEGESNIDFTSTSQDDNLEAECKLNSTEKLQTDAENNTNDQSLQHGEACEVQGHETGNVVENTTHESETTSDAPSVTISEEASLEEASLKEESITSDLPFKSFEEIKDGNGTELKAREYEAEETSEVQPPHETQFSGSRSVGNDKSVETEAEKTLTDDKCLSAEISKKNDDELTIPYPTEKEVGKESDEAPHVEFVTQVHYSEVPSELKESEMKEESLEAATTEKAITEEELPSITTHVISDTAKSDDQCEVSKDQESEASKNIHKESTEISEISSSAVETNKEVAITADDNSSESLMDHEKPDTKPVETACEEKEATEKSSPTEKADDKELETDVAKDEEYSASEVTPLVERDLVDVTSDKIITEVEIKEDNSNVVPDEKNPEQGDRKESTETTISNEDKHIQFDSVPGTVALEIDEPIPLDSSEAAGSNINEEAKEYIEDQTSDSFELAQSIKNEEAVEKIEDQATAIFEAARNDNNEEVTEHNEDQAKVVATSDSETNRDESDSPSSITEEDPKIHDRDVKLENLSPPDQSNTDVCQIDEHLDLATPTEIVPDSIELQNASLATKVIGILEEPQTIESTEVTTISAGKDVDLLQKDPEAADNLEAECKLNFTEKLQTDAENSPGDQLQQHGEVCEEQDHETPDAVENTTHESKTTSDAPSVTISEEAGLEEASLKKEEYSTSELRFKSFEEIKDGNKTEVKEREYEAEETSEVQPPQDVHETQFSDSQSVETEAKKTLTDDKCVSAESSKNNNDELTIPYPTEKEILPEEVRKESDEAPHVESVARVHYSEVPSALKESEMKEESLEAATTEKAITEEELPSITTHVISETAKSDDQREVSKDQEVLSSEAVSLHPDKDIEVNDREYSVEEKSQAHNPSISDSSLVDIPGAEGLESAVSEADNEVLLHKSTNESEISEILNREVAITADDNSSESLIDNEKADTKPVEKACEEKEATEKSLPTEKADDKELETDVAKGEEEESEVQKGEYSASAVTPLVERDLVDVTSDKIITIDEPIPVDSSEGAGSNINEEAKECIEDQTTDSFELARSNKNEEAVEKIEDQATETFEAAQNDNNEEVTKHNEDQATVVATSNSETNRDESDSPSSITEGEDPKIHDRDFKLENLSPPDQSNMDICQIDEHPDLATPTEVAPDSIELQNASLATKEIEILEEPQTIESTEVTTISAGKDVDLLQKDSEAAVIQVQKPKTENDHDAALEVATVESEAKDAKDEFKELEQEASIKQATDSEPDLTQESINTTLSVAEERETLDQLPEGHVSERVPLVQKDSSESREPVISSEEKDTLLEHPVPVNGTVTREIEEIMHANASETEAEAESIECGEEQKAIHDYNQIPESSQSTDSIESAPSNLLHGSADVTTQKVDDIVSETLPSSHLLPSHDQKEPEADPKVTTEIVQAGGEISKCVEQSFEETKSEEEERTKDEMNEATVKSLPAEETNTAAPEEETLEIIEHPSERIEQIVKNDELQTENAESDDDKKLKSDEAKDEEEEGKVQREEKSCSEVPLVAERDLIDGTSSKVIVELETKEDSSSAVLDGKISKQVDTEESIETVISSEDKHIQSDSGAGTVGLEIDESKHADSSEVAGSNKSEEAKEIYEGHAIDSSDAAESNENEGPKENNEDQVTVEAQGSETKQNEDDTQSNITEGDDLKIHVPDVKVENLSPPEQSSTNVYEIDEPLVLAKPTEIAPDTTELEKISLSPKEDANPEEPPSSECGDVTIASRDIDVQLLQNDEIQKLETANVSDAALKAATVEPEPTGTTDESTFIETTKNSESDVVQGSENLTLSVAEEKETLAQPVEDNVYLGVQDLKTGTIQKEEQVNLSRDESIREEVNDSRSFEVPANKIQAQKDPEESSEPVLCSGDEDISRTEEAKCEEVPKVADEINEPATKIVDNSAKFEEEILVVPENAERFEVKDVKTDEEGKVQEKSGFEVPLMFEKDSVDLTNDKIITSEVKEDNSIVVPETIPAQGESEENTEALISREVPVMVTRAVNLENEELKHVNASEPAAETETLECEEDTKATRDYNELPESSKSMEPSKNSTYENPQASAKVTPVEAEVTESQDPESLHVPAHSESSSIENSTKDGASDINITRDKQEPEASPLLASSEQIVLEADQKVTPEPENSECVTQVQQEANSESYRKEPEPANIEEEKKEATEKSLPTETTTSSITTLSENADHVNEAIKVVPEKEELQVKIAETDEKEEGENSGSDAPVIVEASRDIETKVSPKKSNNILSGVGSKVKHSIAKVKKAITGSGKHSHSKESKPTSPK